MAVDRQIALADAPARIGTVEDRKMLVLEVRGPFQGHRTTDMDVGNVDFLFGETESGEHVKARIVQLLVRETQCLLAEILAQGPFVKGELDVKRAFKTSLDSGDLLIRQALALERVVADGVAACQRAAANRISFDILDLLFGL